MAWYDRLLARVIPPEKPDYGFRWLYRRGPIRVTPDSAMSFGAFWGCVRFITGNIAQLPWRVYIPRRSGQGSDEQPNNPAAWILGSRANPEMSAFMFRQVMMLRALVLGNGYAEIERDMAGRVVALWPIDNERVTPDRDNNGELVYRVSNSGGEVTLRSKEMFHLPGLSDDGLIGLSVIAYAARSLGLGIAQEEYGSSFFSNSGVPSGVLEHPKSLSDPATERLRKQWEETYEGVTKGQKTLVLEEGMTYKPVSIPPEQAQFLASRQASVEEIARWFGVPPQKIQQLLHSNYASMEHLSIEVITDTLMPWVKKLEQEADYKLLNGNWGGLFTRLDVRGLMRGTHKDRAEYYRALFGIGVMSVNDIRSKEDLNPVPFGDVHMLPLNMAPLEMVAKGDLAVKQAPEPQKQEPNPPEPTNAQLQLVRLLEATLNEVDDDDEHVYVIGSESHDRPH